MFLQRLSGGVPSVSAVRVGSGVFAISVGRRSVLGRMAHMTGRVGHSLTKGGPLFLDMLGNSFVFATSLLGQVAVPYRVSFIGLTSCRKMSSAKMVGRMVNVGRSLASHAIIVMRSVMSAKLAVRHLLSALNAHNPERVRVTSLLIGPSGLGISLGVRCITVGVPGSFVINCKLSCSNFKHGCPSVCAMMS